MIRQLGINWPSLLPVIEDATRLISSGESCQPVKPYLRFPDPANRIIAMPAWLGGNVNAAGIKWIASFPGNLARDIRRAHSVMVLNDTATGIPTAIINTPLVSGIRTASVSGFVLDQYLRVNERTGLKCGIIGLGPIGQLHLEMLQQCFGTSIDQFYLYDLLPIPPKANALPDQKDKIVICKSWQEVYEQSDLLFTCTVSKERYIDAVPKQGGIYFNVSLRDFQPAFLQAIDLHAVDSWVEICRENTDIEKASLAFGLARTDVLEIADLLEPGRLAGLSKRSFMFNPMGMAIYDIAVGKYFYDLAVQHQQLIELED